MSDYENREEIEWSNTWLSHASSEMDRCLLIGDSVTRELRSKLESFLNGSIAVDLFASSFAITDDMFWNNIKLFLNGEYKYQFIIIHYGFHHGNFMQCHSNKSDAAIFEEKYRKLVEMCKQLCGQVIMMTGNSYVIKGEIDRINVECEPEIHARNAIVKEVAGDLECGIFDLYHLMKTIGKQFKYRDAIHYEQKAYSFIAFSIVTAFPIMDAAAREMKKKEVYQLLDFDRGIKKIIIYGTGFLGYHFYFLLKYFCLDIEITAWAVTDNSDGINEIYGIPVYEIDKVCEKDCLLVIAANEQYKSEMKNIAEGIGFCNIRYFTNIDWKR